MQIKKKIQTLCIKLRVERCIAWLLCAAMIGSMMNLALPVLAANNADSENAADSESNADSENTADSESNADSENAADSESNADTESNADSENTVDSENSVESEGTYCEHHTEHTEECGYVEAVEGQPCTHEHDEQCGYSETSECSHAHDENCGYVEAVEGQPCRFVCEICGGGSEEAAEESGEDLEQSVNVLAAEPMASEDASEDGLIAYFKFDESDRLKNSANSGVTADLYSITDGQAALGSKIESGSWESSYFDGVGGKEDVLHLNNNACLVLDNIDAFKGLDELTVEMKVNIPEAQTQNWLFYATPEGADAANTNNSFGAVVMNNNTRLRAIRNNTSTVNWDSTDGVLKLNTWHTIRVVYKVSTMALYIDNERVAEQGAGYKTADFFTDNTAIWLGHSAWASDKDFNGYIDYIKIYNYAKDDHVIDEKAYIRTATEPPSTTVNMFDYWITGQADNDFNPALTQEQFLTQGINAGHLFLFAGSDASSESDTNGFPNDNDVVGTWNNYFNNGHKTWEPYQGIVKSELDSGGYPQLAIDELNVSIPDALSDRPKTESLAYLFNTNQSHNGKASYSNVSGLFQLGDDGYYSFRSNETFAELNIDQKSGQKKSTNNNHITLYAEPWYINSSGAYLGQFFPFNDASNLFYAGDSGEPIQAHGTQDSELRGQSTTAEPMNHYFGMTVTTQFTQPTDGMLHYYEETQPMTFEFSGDDDVWIFIDGVLVGDLGGLHQRVRITIDYATGIINYEGNLDSDGMTGTQHLDNFDTSLYDMFEKAGKQDTVNWKVVENNDPNSNKGNDYKLFPDDSKHTLKFFYLERGNNMSNCSIRFNLHDYPEVPPTTPPEDEEPTTPPEENPPENEDPDNPTPPNPPKKDKPKNPPTGQPPEENPPAEQPPEEEQAVYLSAGQDVAATPSAEQPQAEESEAKILGVLGSPNTGDSNMTGLWLTLLVFSSAGLVAIHYRTRKR